MNPAKLLAGMARITTTGRRLIPQIDGLRFVAIAAVILFHLRGYVEARLPIPWEPKPSMSLIYRLTSHGHYGVQLFFVISGFILALPFAASRIRGAKRPGLKAYYLRRVTRLEPPYIVSLIVLFFLVAWIRGITLATLVPHLFAGLAYQHNLIYGTGNVINDPAWSLEVEVQFYLLAPLLASIFIVRSPLIRRITIATAALVVIALRTALLSQGSSLGLTLLGFIEFFLAGFLLADVYVADWGEAPQRNWAWDLVSLFGWPSLILVWNTPSLSTWVFPILVVPLYMAAFRGRISSRVLGNKWVVAIGGMCYSLYLLHYPIISAVGRLTSRIALSQNFDLNFALQGLLILPVVLAIGTAFFLTVERPCMRPNWPSLFAARLKTMWAGKGATTPDEPLA